MIGRSGFTDNLRSDRLVCRHQHGTAGRWTRREEEPKYAPDRTCDVDHLRLEIDVDLPARACEAVCRQTLRASYGSIARITLDAWDLELHSVQDGAGRDLPYDVLNRKITVRFPEPVHDQVDLVIRYRVERPIDGLYFMGPDECEPDVEWQLWSQGENEGARHWIPCHDAPNERFTCELIVTADEKYSVIANGELLAVDARDGRRTWHYREGVALPTYLLSMVVGVFSKLEDRWQQVPVEYWVEPDREAEGRRSFGRTPDMIEFFSKQVDRPFPYEKYAQVAVRHFHFGGMENVSATTQTDGTLHDDRAALDFTSDELVAHELAHQWFGDLITCKSWTHAWLNEGFATYFEALWKEWDKGREEFDYEMVLNADAYLDESYRRAIATPKYAYPFELFDAHLYPKAAWVLHMLRRHLGDDLFWKSVRLYLKRHAPGVAETIDLMRAFEDATGRSLGAFFDQWIFAPGHPQLEGEAAWDGDRQWVRLSLKQTQKRDDGTPLFRIPLRVEARGRDGKIVGAGFEMDQAEQTFYLPLSSNPVWVAIDPEGAVLRETKIGQPLAWREAALLGAARDERVFARVDLVRQLGNEAGTQASALLARVLREDPFWGVQVEAAGVLGKLRTPAALEALLGAVTLEHPKARRAVVTALGLYRDPRAAQALLEIARNGDASYFVHSQSLASLGKHAEGEAVAELRTQFREAMSRRDWHDVIALGAVQGLAAARDEAMQEEILAAARDTSRYWSFRLGAVRALAELGSARPHLAPKLVDDLTPFLDDKRVLVSDRTPPLLVLLGHPAALPALQRHGETAALASERESNLKAAEDLSAKLKKGEEVDRLRGEAEKLREEVRELRAGVEELKAKVLPKRGDALVAAKPAAKLTAKPAAKPAAKATAKPTARAIAKKEVPARRAKPRPSRTRAKRKK